METIYKTRTPQLPAGFSVRPAAPADARAIHAIFVASDLADATPFAGSWEEYAQDLERQDINLQTDSRLVLDASGSPAAAAWFFENTDRDLEHSAGLFARVHPQHRDRGIGAWLVDWFEQAARRKFAGYTDNLPRKISASGPQGQADFEAVMQKAGFSSTRRYYKMRCDLHSGNEEPSPPAGLALVPYTPDMDEQVHVLMDTAFRDHPNYQPHTADLWALHTSQSPEFRPEASFLAYHGGNPAGAVVCSIWEEDNQRAGIREGWIDMLGILREYRHVGAGRALMLQAMQAFTSLGMEYAGLFVDSENPTGALHLYQRLGFQPVLTVVRWVKELA